LFPKLSTSDIDSFRAKYIGSEDEKQDILEAYEKASGDIQEMKQYIFFVEDEEEDEQRIVHVLNTALAAEEIELYPAYQQYQESHSNKENKSNKKKKRKASKTQEASLEELASMMKARDEERGHMFDSIIVKHTSSSKPKTKGFKKRSATEEFVDIPDDEFEAIQRSLMKEGTDNSKSSNKKTTSSTTKLRK
jgi:DnaJ homolog subfamily C member 9